MKRHTVILTIFVLGLTIFAQGANSVPIQKKKQQELKHEVTVTLKLIQVYVTDKKGNPVTDLNKDDFKIYDKKKLKEITEFERYALIPQKDKTETQPPKIINIPAEETTDIMNRKFFFFFDLANNNTKGFLKSQQAALHFIDTQLHPSDEVGVLSFSVLKGLVLHEYFTKDRQAIRNVVEQIEAEGRAGRADNFELLLWRELSGEKAVDVSSSGSPIWSAKQDPRLGRLEHKNIVRRMILKITDLAKALCYIPGLKHILLFSSGIPYSLIYGLSTGKSSPVDLVLDRVLVNKYEEMLKELSNANTTIFSLNTEMLATNMNVPANVKGELTLRRMSQYTGGKFLGNVQNYEELLDTVQTFTGSYYVLGYYVDESADGRYNSIEVSVTRPQCNVFAQKGYYNPKMFSRNTKLEKEIHLIDLALVERPLSQIPIRFQMTAQVCSFDNANNLLLAAHLPAEESAKISEGKAEIHSLIFDARNEIISHHRCEEDWPSLAGKEIYLLGSSGIPPGKYRCRIVIRDMETGKAAVAGFTTNVQSEEEKKFQTFPPLLLRQEKGAFYVRGMEAAARSTVPQSFEFADSHLIDTSSYIPFLGRTLAPETDLWASIRCSVPSGLDAGISLSAILFDKTKVEEIALPLEIIREKEEMGVKTFFVRLRIPDVEMDEYTLIFSVEHIVSGNRTETAQDFLIK